MTPSRASRPVSVVVALLLGGCVTLQAPPDGDRLFAAGKYDAAKASYEEYLDRGPADGRRKERALYHLGLIHARPDGSFHDPEKARRYLERLLAARPPSVYASQAALVLELQIETSRLRTARAEQEGLAQRLRAELDRLRTEAEAIESLASGEQERARMLAERIAALQDEMEGLSAELDAREEELARLKQIDLEDPP